MTNDNDTETVAIGRLSKRCEFGHHYYTGTTCPLCEYLGRENVERAHSGGVRN